MIKVGLIGCGKYMIKWSTGVSLIEYLYNNENVEITSICDPIVERMEFAKIINICYNNNLMDNF